MARILKIRHSHQKNVFYRRVGVSCTFVYNPEVGNLFDVKGQNINIHFFFCSTKYFSTFNFYTLLLKNI